MARAETDRPEPPRDRRPAGERSWPPAWFGAVPGDGPAAGARADELLAEGFGRYK
ncbi:MAG TPA: hypothetical protein VHW44_25420 [Pseudonocardiaceae bacterium]|nr:hypothetical protein [Pseudonocardiaceae bacterium]